jgi:hypothetical protein
MARHPEHADAILREMTEMAEEKQIWEDVAAMFDPKKPQVRERVRARSKKD